MTASTATGKRQSGFAKRPDYRVDFVPSPKRVRVFLGGEAIADSTGAMLMRETGHIPVYYFPRDDVRMDLLSATDNQTFCPFKGEASYWTIAAGGKRAENAVWSYQEPFPEAGHIKDYVAFYWDRVDAWFEEDEEIFVHARDPYVRIDVLTSGRPVKVVLGGETVAESRRAMFVFETGMPTRYYVSADDVRMDLLVPGDKRTSCPYKGTAGYWSARLGGETFEDVAWSYPDPLPEVAGIKGLLCYFNERVDAVIVDGAEVPKVRTKWSVG